MFERPLQIIVEVVRFWAIPFPSLFPHLGSGFPLQLLVAQLSLRQLRGFRCNPYRSTPAQIFCKIRQKTLNLQPIKN